MVMYSSAEAHKALLATDDSDARRTLENLPLLYQGMLTGIVRVKARRQHINDGEAFRKRTRATLQEVERFASAAGYDARDVRDTNFAVVAFLDSVILNSTEPIRAEWERKTLQEELFNQTDAGVVFFEKLEHFRTRPDSPRIADILEVYLLCLLLGFEGRYNGPRRFEIDVIVEKVRRRIEDIRGMPPRISPEAELPDFSSGPVVQKPQSDRLRIAAVAAAVFTVLLFLILWWDLTGYSAQLRSALR